MRGLQRAQKMPRHPSPGMVSSQMFESCTPPHRPHSPRIRSFHHPPPGLLCGNHRQASGPRSESRTDGITTPPAQVTCAEIGPWSTPDDKAFRQRTGSLRRRSDASHRLEASCLASSVMSSRPSESLMLKVCLGTDVILIKKRLFPGLLPHETFNLFELGGKIVKGFNADKRRKAQNLRPPEANSLSCRARRTSRKIGPLVLHFSSSCGQQLGTVSWTRSGTGVFSRPSRKANMEIVCSMFGTGCGEVEAFDRHGCRRSRINASLEPA